MSFLAKSRRYELLLLALIILIAVATHAIWFSIDTRPQPSSDPNLNIWKTLQAIDSFPSGKITLSQTMGLLGRAGRPPLFPISSIPFIVLIGRSQDAALMVNALYLAITIIAAYAMGRVSLNGRAGLVAAFVIATMSPILDLSRIFMHSLATVAATAVVVALLQHTLKSRTVKSAWALGFAIGVAALIHPKAVFYVAPPALILCTYAVFFQQAPRYPTDIRQFGAWFTAKLKDEYVWKGLLPAAAIGVAIALIWYIPYLTRIVNLSGKASDRWHEVTHGFDDTARSYFWFMITSPKAISWPYSLLGAVSFVVLLFSRRELIYTLLVTTVVMYITHSSVPGALSWMNGAAMLPILAAIIGIAVLQIANSPPITVRGKLIGRTLQYVLLVAILLTGLFSFIYSSAPVNAGYISVAQKLGSPIGETPCSERQFVAFCPTPPLGGNWAFSDIISTVDADEACQNSRCDLVVQDRMWYPYEYFLIQDHPGSHVRVTSLSNPRRKVNGYLRWNYLASDFVAFDPTLDELGSTLLASPDSYFADVYDTLAEYELPDGRVRRLVKRTHPLTALQTAYISLLNLDFAIEFTPDNVEAVLEAAKEELTGLADEDADAALSVLETYATTYGADSMQPISDYIQGEKAFRLGEYESAIDLLGNAVSTFPNDIELRLTLAKSFRELGQSGDAIEQAQSAAELAPESPDSYALLGALYRDEGQLDDVVSSWRQSLVLQPNQPDICFRLARELEALDSAQALELFATCAALDPTGKYGEKSQKRLDELQSSDSQ